MNVTRILLAFLTLIGAAFVAACTTPQEHGVASESGNIIVYQPSPHDAVSSPVVVTGIARVFEANVLIRIRGANGSELAFTFTTASTAGPEFGDFEEEVEYQLAHGSEQGTVEVFSISAKTGEEEDMVRIPVRLLP